MIRFGFKLGCSSSMKCFTELWSRIDIIKSINGVFVLVIKIVYLRHYSKGIIAENWEKSGNSSFSSPINSNGTPLSPYKVFLPQVVGRIFGGHALFSPGPKKQLLYSKDFSGVVGTKNDRLDLLSPNKFSLGEFDKAFSRYGPVYEFCARNLEKNQKRTFLVQYTFMYICKRSAI